MLIPTYPDAFIRSALASGLIRSLLSSEVSSFVVSPSNLSVLSYIPKAFLIADGLFTSLGLTSPYIVIWLFTDNYIDVEIANNGAVTNL